MARLLHIESSPRKERSASIAVAHHFLDAYRAAHPQDTIETLDLWQAGLPALDAFAIDAKYAVTNGQPYTNEQATAWEAIVTVVDHFKSFDKYLFSVPMWNFGIPYVLKHYIDLVVQSGLTFDYTPNEGYKGLVTGKPAALVYARGGAYGPGTGAEAYDKQSDYLKHVLGFIGFTDVRPIFVEPTMAGPETKDRAVAIATKQADRIARGF
jgi:FMN-dependent NADH-azoreductase